MTRSLRRLLSSAGFLAVALGPCRAWAVTENYCSFPTSLTTWTYNGNAFEALNSVIRLTDSGVLAEASSAFVTAPIALTAATPLHAYFRFQMGPTPTGGDGVAFVLQNSPLGAAALGGTSVKMGYSAITPSVEIVFGTFKNTAGTAPANNVSVVLNGSTTANVATASSATVGFTMAGAGVLSGWVDYNPTGTVLSIYVATTAMKPKTPTLTYTGTNLFGALGTQAYVGFTSATGATAAETNEHDVYELEISTAGIPCACEGDSACSSTSATPACDAAGLCAICSATNATGCPGTTPVCDVPTNTCVGCLTNANCADPKPICDTTALTCRACSSNADCGGSTPQCATSGVNAGDCVLCLSTTDCPQSTPICTSSVAPPPIAAATPRCATPQGSAPLAPPTPTARAPPPLPRARSGAPAASAPRPTLASAAAATPSAITRAGPASPASSTRIAAARRLRATPPPTCASPARPTPTASATPAAPPA